MLQCGKHNHFSVGEYQDYFTRAEGAGSRKLLGPFSGDVDSKLLPFLALMFSFFHSRLEIA